jgi:hypothetical protein
MLSYYASATHSLSRGAPFTLHRRSALLRVDCGEVWVTRVGGEDEVYAVGERFAAGPGVVIEPLTPTASLVEEQ